MINTLPSQTAIRVALSLVTLNAGTRMRRVLPKGLGDATERLLLASGMADSTVVRMARRPLAIGLGMAINPLMSGEFEALAYRKAFCENAVLEAIDGSVRQVLVLGAGFDTLCWRLASAHTACNFVEIDHPATSRAKVRGIRQMGQPANMNMLAADLSRQSLRQVLADEESWDSKAASIIVAEGLLMYLRPDDVSNLFRETAASVGPESAFALSHFLARKNGKPDLGPWSEYALLGLRLIGEPVQWAIRKDHLADFVTGSGWQPVAAEKQPRPDGAGIEGYALLQRVPGENNQSLIRGASALSG
jgi:methyltransferase (TIGR00027 family)